MKLYMPQMLNDIQMSYENRVKIMTFVDHKQVFLKNVRIFQSIMQLWKKQMLGS